MHFNDKKLFRKAIYILIYFMLNLFLYNYVTNLDILYII